MAKGFVIGRGCTVIFCYLHWTREGMVLPAYEGAGRQSEFHWQCMVFAGTILLLGHPRSNQRCVVAETVLPSPTTGSNTQEGCFMLIEWSDWFCGTFTAGIFELLLQMKVCRVDSFSGVCVLDVTIYND